MSSSAEAESPAPHPHHRLGASLFSPPHSPAGLQAAPPPVRLEKAMNTSGVQGPNRGWERWGGHQPREVADPGAFRVHFVQVPSALQSSGVPRLVGVCPPTAGAHLSPILAHPWGVGVCLGVRGTAHGGGCVCDKCRSRAGPLIPTVRACSRWVWASPMKTKSPCLGLPLVSHTISLTFGGPGGESWSQYKHTKLSCSIFRPLYLEPGGRGAGAVVQTAQEPF